MRKRFDIPKDRLDSLNTNSEHRNNILCENNTYQVHEVLNSLEAKYFFAKPHGISVPCTRSSIPARVTAITPALVTPHPYVGLVTDAESPIARKLSGRDLYL